jgi:murein DD-endopeptidase MepM/ murein hydrolase activator NlpD
MKLEPRIRHGRAVPALIFLVVALLLPAEAAGDESLPFGLPFRDPPGPSTWVLVQPYGNTTTAYEQRRTEYGAGQGLHFGVDFGAPCGTAVVAIGDGVVTKIDAPEHGALPHNLMIVHDNGYASFYGHLLRRPALKVGQAVRRGDVIALTGDSYGTCHSAPHLHLEIRDRSYRIAYNPATLIDADWDNLALAVNGATSFMRNLDSPRRWQFLTDQPEIQMGGPLLNDYVHVWFFGW